MRLILMGVVLVSGVIHYFTAYGHRFLIWGRLYFANFLETTDFSPISIETNWGDVGKGRKAFGGEFSYGVHRIAVGVQGDPWFDTFPSMGLASYVHGFEWLNDFTAFRQDKKTIIEDETFLPHIEKRACELVDLWIAGYGGYNLHVWDYDITTRRVLSWLLSWKSLLSYDKNRAANINRRYSLFKQILFLKRFYKTSPQGVTRMRAATCLIVGGFFLGPKYESYIDDGLYWLENEIDKQIFKDGGHKSRNPQNVANCLEILHIAYKAMLAGGAEKTEAKKIKKTLQSLSAMLVFFTRPEGGVYNFHGAGEGNVAHLKKLLALGYYKGSPFGVAPQSQFQRIENNGIVALFDTGNPPAIPYNQQAHLSPLALEISTKEGALLVNCGWSHAQNHNLRPFIRKSAAHSTLVLNDHSAGKILTAAIGKKILGPIVVSKTDQTTSQQRGRDDGVLAEATHYGYLQEYGLAHRREIFISADGEDIRGHDSLFVPQGRKPYFRDHIPFAIRFHFHPDVRVSLMQAQNKAFLLQNNGSGWIFKCNVLALKLEKSIYLATDDAQRPCQQLVVYGHARGDNDGKASSNLVKWAFKRGNMDAHS